MTNIEPWKLADNVTVIIDSDAEKSTKDLIDFYAENVLYSLGENTGPDRSFISSIKIDAYSVSTNIKYFIQCCEIIHYMFPNRKKVFFLSNSLRIENDFSDSLLNMATIVHSTDCLSLMLTGINFGTLTTDVVFFFTTDVNSDHQIFENLKPTIHFGVNAFEIDGQQYLEQSYNLNELFKE